MTLLCRPKNWSPLILLIAALSVQAQTASRPPTLPAAESQVLPVANASFPVSVLVESPAATKTDLQGICLFRSDPSDRFHGSLAEIDKKLGGLLSQVRKANLFSGALGETLLIAP
jgi:hypothetical protein